MTKKELLKVLDQVDDDTDISIGVDGEILSVNYITRQTIKGDSKPSCLVLKNHSLEY